MTTIFESVAPEGVVNLRMGAPGDKILLRSAELMKNAAHKLMVSNQSISKVLVGHRHTNCSQ